MRYQSYQVRPQATCPVLSCLSCSHTCHLLAAQLTSFDNQRPAGHVAFLPSFPTAAARACVLALLSLVSGSLCWPTAKTPRPPGT